MLPKHYIALLIFLSLICYERAEATTLVLRPDSVAGKDASITDWDPNGNYGNHPEYGGCAWTCFGPQCIQRSMLQFTGLSQIPAGSHITSAHLSLFANPAPVNCNGIAMQGANESVVQRITSTWDENTVTWNTQPATTIIDQLIIPPTANQNYQAYLDVAAMVQTMIDSPATNFGFLIKQTTEIYYCCMLFASSDFADSSVWPMLDVTYDTPACVTLHIGKDSGGQDCAITSGAAAIPYPYHPDYASASWTCQGDPCIGRSFLQFDLSAFPANTIVTSSTLYLHANLTSLNGFPGLPTWGSNNASYLERITTAWIDTSTSWITQPTTTTQNAVTLAQSTNTTEDYNADVTLLVQDMLANPTTSFGFRIRQITEANNAYNDMIFCSSDHTNNALHPTLQICFVLQPVNVSSFTAISTTLFPNPASKTCTVQIGGLKDESRNDVEIKIFSAIGRLEKTEKISSSNQQLDISELAAGIYFYCITEKENALANGKLVVY